MQLYEKVKVMGEGLTLSLIVWRRYHKPMPGLVAAILDLNQDLAEVGVELPLGKEFLMPVEKATETILEPIQLW